jgi:hypothetical protein
LPSILLAGLVTVAAAAVRADVDGAASNSLVRTTAAVARRYSVDLLVDPAIGPMTALHDPGQVASIEEALGRITAAGTDLKWRRITLPPDARGLLPEPGQLAAVARSMDAVRCGGVAVVERKEPRTVLLRSGEPRTDADERKAFGLRAMPVYLLYRATEPEEGAAAQARLSRLQSEQVGMDAPDGQQALAMVQTMMLLKNYPPAQLEAMMTQVHVAGMRQWEATPADQRNEMMQSAIGLLSRLAPGPQAPMGGQRTGEAPRPPVVPNHLSELREAARTLSRRYGAPFLVDPEIYLTSHPRLPEPELAADGAGAALSGSVHGVAFRALYLPKSVRDDLEHFDVARLAAGVRELTTAPPVTSLFEDGAGPPLLLRGDLRKPQEIDAELERSGFSRQLVYLFYSTTPSGRGATYVERLADLQRQQMRLLLKMNPDQLSGLMEQQLQTYQAADPQTRNSILSLPVMAWMMATWMPRAAKERRQ